MQRARDALELFGISEQFLWACAARPGRFGSVPGVRPVLLLGTPGPKRDLMHSRVGGVQVGKAAKVHCCCR